MSRPRQTLNIIFAAALCAALATTCTAAEEQSRLDEVLETVVANEREMAEKLARFEPLVETYVQTARPDALLGSVPVNDDYFFGRLHLAKTAKGARRNKRSHSKRPGKKSVSLLANYKPERYKPESLTRMFILDAGTFDRQHYDFDFVRAEFLGEIRSLVFDVTPKPGKVSRMSSGRFTGRIWVEDDRFNIVRFNGIYTSTLSVSFHFDSWRLHMPSGDWLPAYVYTEESEINKHGSWVHRGQTRLWGYRIERPDVDDEFTKVLIDTEQTHDPSDRPGQVSPLGSAKAWESEAEDNLIHRLEKAGFLAPEGEVNEVLSTVVANLEITNELNIDPPVRCRVLLTTPLESFTIGRTIVLSRGLIDVLPDEASLAMVLAHELGHVLSGHEVDTKYAFSNQMLVDDGQALESFVFQRSAAEEQEADDRALVLLGNSPYKNDLTGAGLFLKMLSGSTESLSSLIRPHFGRDTDTEPSLRMAPIVAAAPELDPASLSQIAALPLGSRVQLDPWNANIELMKNDKTPMVSARDKLPLQVTPLMPYLARHESTRISLGAESSRPAVARTHDYQEDN